MSLTTPHGTTSFPSLLFEGDAGNFNTSREQLELAGSHGHFDYLGSFNWLQTGNALPHDEYHVATSTANLGWQPSGTTQFRGTIHYLVDGAGVPNAWDFYHVADDASEKDQNIYVSASFDNQTSEAIHNSIRYGLARKREQENLWNESGNQEAYTPYCFGPGTLGNVVTITGANGYTATGQAVLDCSTYGSQLVNNRDQLVYRGDITITPHLAALIGFQYEDERGSEPVWKQLLTRPSSAPITTTRLQFTAIKQESLFLHAGWEPRALIPLRRPDDAARRSLVFCVAAAQRSFQRNARHVQLRRFGS